MFWKYIGISESETSVCNDGCLTLAEKLLVCVLEEVMQNN